MAAYYDKDKLKEQLDIASVYDLLTEFGAEPEYMSEDVLISQTICHNMPGEGSRKLYYYENTKLFRCYTDCDDTFDLFQLVIKVAKLQKNKKYELYDAMHYVATYFGLDGEELPEDTNQDGLTDWSIFQRYAEISSKQTAQKRVRPQLKEYDPIILTRLSYPAIVNWENEGITREICKYNKIGYYPMTEQITIPHFDTDGRFIGLRGRFLAEEDVERYGKYRPLMVNKISYKHPLSANLYNLNNSKMNISRVRAAVVFEGEKSSLLYQSYYGLENDISVACCGSSLSSFQVDLLLELGVKEIIIAFDRQFQEINDDEFKRLTKKLIAINKKYGYYVKVSALFDKDMITSYKASPIDEGKEKFEYLLKNRIIPR
ncbi:MAG: hypothetical protein NC218_11460 [Acetobacter sp.]|nr:hypothetical protein [Acetobacter sp.]